MPGQGRECERGGGVAGEAAGGGRHGQTHANLGNGVTFRRLFPRPPRGKIALINLFALLSSANERRHPGPEKPPLSEEHGLKPTFAVQIACICSWEREMDPCHDTPTEMSHKFFFVRRWEKLQ